MDSKIDHTKKESLSRSVLIFRETLLPISETFIKAQASALKRYEPVYCGLYPAKPSLLSPGEAVLLRPDDSLPSRLRLAAYRRLNMARVFAPLLDRSAVSIVHAHFAPDAVTALPLARWLKVPLIVTLHGYDVTKQISARSNYERLWEEARMFLCVSEFIRDRAIARGFPKEKLRVHYIGVDEQTFTIAGTASDTVPPPSILFVGRLVQKKGCEYLIDAMRIVQGRLPTAQLTIIGDGPLRAALSERAKDRKISATFLGAQNTQVIQEHMQKSSVFCVPSVTAEDGDSEGFGIVFLEAQAMGVPVVSFRHGGIPESVADGISGLLAEERDTEGLAQTILRILTDEPLRRSFGEAGRKRVQEIYSLAKRTVELESIYDELLDKTS